MKGSLIIAILLILFVGYQCLVVKKTDCPYGAEWVGDTKSVKLLPPEERKLVSAVRHRFPVEDTGPKRLIPKTIVQTNENLSIPQRMFDATDTILNNNPEYEYIYFTDQEAKKFLRDHFDRSLIKAYEKVLPGAYRADLFRYCYLWIKGGVYIDMGMVGLDSLDKIINPTDTFIGPEDNGTSNAIYNAFMACSPKHPIVGEAIRMAVENIENNNYTHNPLGITGPLLLGKAFENVTGEKVIPGKNYGNGVRIIKFNKYNRCESGLITDRDISFLATRYPSYRVDQKWYNTKPHYSELWEKRQVFEI